MPPVVSLIWRTAARAPAALPPANFNQSVTYDNLGRLTSYTVPGGTVAYTYDANGNRLSKGGSTYTVDNLSNKLLKTTPTAATRLYDANGNLTDDGNFTYAYSPRGRLKSATNKTTTVVTNYTYNSLEQRLSKQTGTDAASLIQYVYDEQGHLLGEYDSNGYPLQETVYLGDTPIAVLKQTRTGIAPNLTFAVQTYFVYADHLDTPRVITQASNNLMVWRWDATDPFGVLQPNENPSGLGSFKYNPRFPGQVYDVETNLNYNVHRSYDSNTGSYTTSDPIGLKGGWNTYTYVGGNPVNAVDPTGLDTLTWGIRGLGAIGLAVPGAEPVGLLLLTLSLSGDTSKSNDDCECKETIYRAIDPIELAYVTKYHNYGFSPSRSGKYFALTLTGVQNFVNTPFNSGINLTLTSTTVSKCVIESGYNFNDIGGAGPSVHFSDDQLPGVYSTMTPIQIFK